MKTLFIFIFGVATGMIGCASTQNASHHKEIPLDTLGIIYTVHPIQFFEIPAILKDEFSDTLESHCKEAESVIGRQIIYIYMGYSGNLKIDAYTKAFSFHYDNYLKMGYYKIVNENPLLWIDHFKMSFNDLTYSIRGTVMH